MVTSEKNENKSNEIETENEIDDTVSIQSFSEILIEIDDHYKAMTHLLSLVKKLTRDLEKSHKRTVKTARKSRKKTSSSNDKKEPSGFQKPQPVPVEFYDQPWGCTADQELPRTVLTKMVYDYIKENKLQEEEDKRVIKPDETLRTLFHINEGDRLEFKNFQTYMAKLYKRDFRDKSDTDNQSDVSVEATPVVEEKKEKKSKKKTKALVSNI